MRGLKMDSTYNNYIAYGEFTKLKEALQPFSFQDRQLKLVTIACRIDSIATYTAACFFILDQENVETHHAASMIVASVLVHYKGAYSSGLFHARRMIQLDPNDYTNFEWGIFFYRIPENLVTRREAYFYAQQILTIDPKHTLALKTKSEIENKWLLNVPEPKQYIPEDSEYPEFIKLVHTGFYEKAKTLVRNYSFSELEKLLCILMERYQSVTFYTYAFFMLLDQETIQGHLLAGKLLLKLKGVFGAQSGALFHARRAVELEPHSLICLEFVLLFYNLPGPMLADVEAFSYAKQILAINPRHEDANRVVGMFPKQK